MKENSERKKVIAAIFTIIAIMLIVIVISIIGILNKEGERKVEIANLNEYIDSNRTDEDSIELIKGRLFETIGYNVDDEKMIRGLKILVRDGSFEQSYDKSNGLNKVSFIVDIEEIGQSYLASYEWDDQVGPNGESDIDEWASEITCLDKDKLIYGDFGCKDKWSFVYDVRDPIARILPHIVNNRWAVSYVDDYNGNIYKLQLDIYACIDKQADPLEEEAWAWMRENIPNLDDYRVDVSYCK